MKMMVTFPDVVVGVSFMMICATRAGDEPSVKRSKVESICVDKSSPEWNTRRVAVLAESVDAAIQSSDRIWLSSLSEILNLEMKELPKESFPPLSALSKSE